VRGHRHRHVRNSESIRTNYRLACEAAVSCAAYSEPYGIALPASDVSDIAISPPGTIVTILRHACRVDWDQGFDLDRLYVLGHFLHKHLGQAHAV